MLVYFAGSGSKLEVHHQETMKKHIDENWGLLVSYYEDGTPSRIKKIKEAEHEGRSKASSRSVANCTTRTRRKGNH